MLIIDRESTDPYFNIAAEEYLVKTMEVPCFMLWQNTPSVVIGKHQNPLREVNLKFTNKENIPVIRRISGGGTVYHDLGNINYSFIDMGKADSLVNFPKYSQAVLNLLNKLGVPAELSGKSDLKIKGKKFSGNASHVYKNKVLHHGTILFNSDLDTLNESIQIKNHQITDKAVNSNRSVVTNITKHLKSKLELNDFKTLLIREIQHSYPEAKNEELTTHQIQEINQLVKEKYKSWNWNFGYSPKYIKHSSFNFNGSDFDFSVKVEKGFVKEITYQQEMLAIFKEVLDNIVSIQFEKKMIESHLEPGYPKKNINIIIKALFPDQ